MENKLKYENFKFSDWSKLQVLSKTQVNRLILEKVIRAKMYSEAVKKIYRKLD